MSSHPHLYLHPQHIIVGIKSPGSTRSFQFTKLERILSNENGIPKRLARASQDQRLHKAPAHGYADILIDWTPASLAPTTIIFKTH